MKKLQTSLSLTVLSVLMSLPAYAQTGLQAPAKIPSLPGDQNETATRFLGTYINIALAVVGILAVAFIIYGGFRYITSGGNEEAAEAGKKAILNGIIGLIIIILSYIIITVIINALAGQRI